MPKQAAPNPKFDTLVRFIVERFPGITMLALVKTIYFLELAYLTKFGEPLTEAPIVRLPMGPVPSGYEQRLKRAAAAGIILAETHDYCRQGRQEHCIVHHSGNNVAPYQFQNIELNVLESELDRLVAEVGNLSVGGAGEKLKTLSYATLPMLRILETERKGRNCRGTKVLERPYFPKRSIDSRAKYRRTYRDACTTANPHDAAERAIDREVCAELAPLVEETLRHG